MSAELRSWLYVHEYCLLFPFCVYTAVELIYTLSFNHCFFVCVATSQNLLAVDENKGNVELWIVHTLCTTTWMLGSTGNNSHHSLGSIFKDASFLRFLGSHPQWNGQSFKLEPGSRTLPSLCFSLSENQAVIIFTFQI